MARQSLISRRRALGVSGAGTTAAPAGCSGNGQGNSSNGDSGCGGTGTDSSGGFSDSSGGNGSDADGTTEDSQSTEDGTSTSSAGDEPGEYPTQETSGLITEADQLADEESDVYAFRMDNYEFLK